MQKKTKTKEQPEFMLEKNRQQNQIKKLRLAPLMTCSDCVILSLDTLSSNAVSLGLTHADSGTYSEIWDKTINKVFYCNNTGFFKVM